MFGHICGTYDPKEFCELYGNFWMDRNIGCFTTLGRQGYSLNRKRNIPEKNKLGFGQAVK